MYCQDAGSYAYRLKPRTPYVSRSLCFTPRFWEQLAFDRRSDGDALLERFATAPQVLNAPHVGAMLQRLDARTADAAATELHLTALAARGRRLPHGYRRGRRTGRSRSGQQRSGPSGRDARALLERHLDAPLTLESIARELCVSRSRLAATYKAERGRGVAEELRDLRMERAASFWPARTSLCPRWAAPWAIRARLPSPPPSPARSAAPRRLAQTAPPLRPRCCGIPSSGLYKREGAPRGSFLSHLSLPDLLGPRSAVLRRTGGRHAHRRTRCSAACSPASLPQPTAATRHRFSALPPAQDAPSCASSTFLSPPSRYGFLSGSILAELNQPEPSLTRSFGSWQGERRTSAPDHLQAARRPRVPEAAAIRWVQSQLPPSASSMMAFTAAGLSALELWAGAFYPRRQAPYAPTTARCTCGRTPCGRARRRSA